MIKWSEIQILKLRSLIQKDTTFFAVDIKSKIIMTFKNGSVIKTLPLKNTETIRGHRSKLPLFYDNFEYDAKSLDEVLKKHTKA